YPRTYEDQENWKGGWELGKNGRLKLKAGGRVKKLLEIFSSPTMPSLDDYYEPWTYDYDMLVSSPLQEHTPVARPYSLISGKAMDFEWSAHWEDCLLGAATRMKYGPRCGELSEEVQTEFEQTCMLLLPRTGEHRPTPSCVSLWPYGARYKRVEEGIVLVDQ